MKSATCSKQIIAMPGAVQEQQEEAQQPGQDQLAWRQGRPMEDPYKLKTWGFIAAKPSEFLIHYRRGKLRARSSGQGASCLKLPWDTVAILPTSFKEVTFEAHQVTSDNVDVRIRGLVVYRIAEPLKTYKMVNFSFRERAEEKLSFTISDICRSAAKWLVANMTVDECIRRRREEIAEALKAEASRVVSSGEGGWGLALDTIHIQDVFVVDEDIFRALQQKYKSEALLAAALARIEGEKRLKQEEMAAERLAREAKLRIETEMADLEREAATNRATEDAKARQLVAEAEKKRKIHEAECEAEVRLKGISDAERLAAAQIEQGKRTSLVRVASEEEVVSRELSRDAQVARAKKEAESFVFDLDTYRVQKNDEIAMMKVEAVEGRQTFSAAQERERALVRVSAEAAEHEEELRFRRTMREIENAVADGRITEQFVTETLPEVAKAFSAQFGRISVTHFGGAGAGAGLSPVAGAFAQLLEVARAHGIDLSCLLNRAHSGRPEPQTPKSES